MFKFLLSIVVNAFIMFIMLLAIVGVYTATTGPVLIIH